jgi:hypothetical protein
LLRSSFNTPCTHPAKVDAHLSLCSETIASSQDSLNHVQSHLWPADRPALMRYSRSSTSKRLFLHLAPPALVLPAPNASKVKVLIACLQARKLSVSSMFFFYASHADFLSSIAFAASRFLSLSCPIMCFCLSASCSSALRRRKNASATAGASRISSRSFLL